MKKLYILGLSLISLGAVNAQAYLGKDFEMGSDGTPQDIFSGGFTTQVVTGTADWIPQSYSNNNYVKMTNYSGGSNTASETWYITPAVDLSNATSPVFSFASSLNYTGPAMEMFVSVDYDGTSTPSSATWTALTGALSGGGYAWVNSGEIAISSTSATTYFAFKYTGSNSDGATWQVDSIFVAETGTIFENTVIGAPITGKTITEIQSDVDGGGYSNLQGSSVNTSGIVTAIYPVDNNGNEGYYIQDGTGAWTGVFVQDAVNTPVIGDSVTLTAIVSENYGYTTLITITNFVNVSSFNDVAPTLVSTIAAGSEMYESVLCKVVNSTCDTAANFYGEWYINDGSGPLLVNDKIFDYGSEVVGTAYDVTGVIRYSYSKWSITPRDANDVSVHITSIRENNSVLTNVYPNPTSNGTVTIEVKEASDLIVTDILGNVVLTKVLVNNTNVINVSNLAAGNYILKVGTSVQQLIVK